MSMSLIYTWHKNRLCFILLRVFLTCDKIHFISPASERLVCDSIREGAGLYRDGGY